MTKNKFNKKLLLVPIILSVLVGIYYSVVKNVQKTGLTGQVVIKEDEINFYLDSLNTERFTEESKKPIREYIKGEFDKYGYKVTEQKTGQFINLIADKEGISEPYILMVAHYDTVPNTVGIDDNASGIAILLAIAKHNQNQNIRFVAFDGEESDLSGSKYYVKNISLKPSMVVAFETVGYYSEEPNTQTVPIFYNLVYSGVYKRLKENQFRGDFSAAICANNTGDFCNKYESYGSSLGLDVYSLYIPNIFFLRIFFFDLFRSDHAPFALENIPAVMITDTANFRTPYYHKASDTRYTVNTEFIAKQANAILSAIR